MKILLIHADFIEWVPTKKAMKAAEEAEKVKSRSEEVLVAFCAVEKSDEKNPSHVASNAVKEILDVAGKINAKNAVVYPYAHLSSDLGSPAVALRVLNDVAAGVGKELSVKQAPFGWYKSFNIKAKGHPLSELSKEISAEGHVKTKRPPAKIVLDRKSLPSNDHRILSEELGIFHFADEVGAGLPLWLPNGEILRNELINYMRKVEEKYGYKYVHTPDITKGSLFEATGHLPYYKDSMYSPIDIDGVDYYLRPMNCPHHHMIFKKMVKSYRDLPLALCEAGNTYRNELSGVTYGLIRARCFTINDSHIYVTPEQLKTEFIKVLKMFDEVYKVMRIKGYWFRLSLPNFKKNPDKFIGDPKEWEFASKEIRKAMKDFGVKFVEEIGEAAFYGPKIDVQIKNVMGKEETIATSQVDIVVPKRLGLAYADKDDKKKHVIVIHRAILGSYERFIAYLLEQTKGSLPLWLSPVQVKVLSFTERNNKTAEKLAESLKKEGIRVETDTRDHTVEYKVREAEVTKIPYILVIGDKEEKSNTIAVRERGSKKVAFGVKKEDFLNNLLNRIEKKA
ncbi:MAG: threonine--tRNA ligase [Candidatus Aenigmarchaeota archaeon]|nr:threonine--tRNA ligase [Candidatus Aenigmarchaeota archaeon]